MNDGNVSTLKLILICVAQLREMRENSRDADAGIQHEAMQSWKHEKQRWELHFAIDGEKMPLSSAKRHFQRDISEENMDCQPQMDKEVKKIRKFRAHTEGPRGSPLTHPPRMWTLSLGHPWSKCSIKCQSVLSFAHDANSRRQSSSPLPVTNGCCGLQS